MENSEQHEAPQQKRERSKSHLDHRNDYSTSDMDKDEKTDSTEEGASGRQYSWNEDFITGKQRRHKVKNNKSKNKHKKKKENKKKKELRKEEEENEDGDKDEVDNEEEENEDGEKDEVDNEEEKVQYDREINQGGKQARSLTV